MLTLKTKTTMKWNDGVSETTVSLSPEDDQETLVRKLRKVLALAEPLQPAPGGAGPEEPITRRFPVGSGTNGWKRYAEAPEVPEHLKNEVELIGEEES